ncbi:MAG: hypothetical protein ACK5SY_00770 [bacterium]|jgi:hypothetical protein|uniref:Uncharacterized protein n=1 Tax=Bacteriophage sp. TaxID=38018 RepID=A0A7G9A3T4_9VIRU|nr:MAG: hypothetical protein [Bacteriophage sp.]
MKLFLIKDKITRHASLIMAKCEEDAISHWYTYHSSNCNLIDINCIMRITDILGDKNTRKILELWGVSETGDKIQLCPIEINY